ncbi:MAG: hypothetical protein IPL65_17095 [Lewinellaceae bacterium]|nr:hypothetical protein [Lewinellaceae bacterium]
MENKKETGENKIILTGKNKPGSTDIAPLPDKKNKPECFVIMPFSDPEGYAPGHFQLVYDLLYVPACEEAGYKAYRADDSSSSDLIHFAYVAAVVDSPMAICDLSSHNPNVLFEPWTSAGV